MLPMTATPRALNVAPDPMETSPVTVVPCSVQVAPAGTSIWSTMTPPMTPVQSRRTEALDAASLASPPADRTGAGELQPLRRTTRAPTAATTPTAAPRRLPRECRDASGLAAGVSVARLETMSGAFSAGGTAATLLVPQ